MVCEFVVCVDVVVLRRYVGCWFAGSWVLVVVGCCLGFGDFAVWVVVSGLVCGATDGGFFAVDFACGVVWNWLADLL